MNKRYLISSLVVAFVVISFYLAGSVSAEVSNLYFLSGHTAPYSDAKFMSIVFRYDGELKKLVNLREVVSEKDGTEFIYADYDRRTIVLREAKIDWTGDNWIANFSVIDMDEPVVNSRFSISYPDMSIIDSYLFDIPNKGLCQGLYLRGEKSETGDSDRLFLTLGLDALKQSETSWEDFKYFRVSGLTGGGIYSGDFFRKLKPSTTGELLISVAKRKVPSGFILPESLNLNSRDKLAVYVNNDRFLGFAPLSKRVSETPNLGSTVFYIFDKLASTWHTVRLGGRETAARGFGQWLVGYISGEWSGEPSPGKEKRRQTETSTGRPVDFMFEFWKEYSPGILFMHNINERKTYYITTGQGDNEILLVENSTVYYRVYDEIYEANITENGVEPGTLLIKAEVVPDIHWAFIGPSVQ